MVGGRLGTAWIDGSAEAGSPVGAGLGEQMFGPYIHQIDPVLFNIAGVCVWWYGLGFAIGFLEIHLFLRRGHRRLGLSLREVWSLTLFIALGVLIGGRAVEIMFDEWPFYREHLTLIPAYWLGGMATHGLMLGGAIGAGLFALLYQKPFLPLADALVIPAAFLMGIGRIGNFIDGQIVGAVTDVWWAVKFPDADGFRHPVVLYDGLKNLALMVYLLHVRRVSTTPGATAARFVFWYAFPRFFIDLFRDYPTHRLALGTGQTLNIAMTLLGVALLYRSRLRRLGRLTGSSATTPVHGRSHDAAPLVSQRIAFVCLLVFCLTIPSNWTQDIPSRYGTRHQGLEHCWLYPMINTAAPPRAANHGTNTAFRSGAGSVWALALRVPVPAVAASQSPASAIAYEPRSRTPFPVLLTPPGGTMPHRLMGTAVRQRTIFRVKIYAFGLYVDPEGARASLTRFAGASASALGGDESFYRQLLDLEFAMTLRLVMTRTVDGVDVAETFDDAIRPRIARAVTDTTDAAEFAALQTFRSYFDGGEIEASTEIVFSCGPAGRLKASLGGDERPPIDSPALCRALFDLYLGEDSISDDGKKRVIVGFPDLIA